MSFPVTFGGETFQASDFTGWSYAKTWERYLTAFAASVAQVASDEESVTAAKGVVEASLAMALSITGGAQGVGTDPLDVPRITELGDAAFASVDWLMSAVMQQVTAGFSLVPIDRNKVFVATTSSITITLPAIADVPPGWWVTIKNRSGGNITVDRAGVNLNGAASNLTVANGSIVRIGRLGAAWESF